jgi:hypothetical protein
MDPLRNAINQHAFTPEARAEINDRFARMTIALNVDDDHCPPTTRTGQEPAPQCNEVACKYYGHYDRVPSGDCFEVHARSRDEIIESRMREINGMLAMLSFGISELPDVVPQTTITPPQILPSSTTATLERVRDMRTFTETAGRR